MAAEFIIPRELYGRLKAQLPKGREIAHVMVDLEKSDLLGPTCNGDKPFEFTVVDVYFSPSKQDGDQGHTEAIYFENGILGSRIGFVPESMMPDDFAETLVDSSCAAAGCNNGQNCALKRVSQNKNG